MSSAAVTPRVFAEDVLSRLGAKPSRQNVADVVGWEAQEGGNWNNSARYNPLNTTMPEPGAGAVNSAGVKSYTSWTQGVDATVQTLVGNASYQGIIAALKNNAPLSGFEAAVNGSPWGTEFTGAGNTSYNPPSSPSSSSSSPASSSGGLSGTILRLGEKGGLFLALALAGAALVFLGIRSATKRPAQ